jgi:nuclear pore complex protein Nup133
LQEHLSKNRLDEWFKAACRAGKNAYIAEKNERRRASSAFSAQEEAAERDAIPEAEASSAKYDVMNGVSQDGDVEMQES